MIEGDPIVHIFLAYKAYMAEHTGLSWEEVDLILRMDKEFWRDRPEMEALVRDHRQDT